MKAKYFLIFTGLCLIAGFIVTTCNPEPISEKSTETQLHSWTEGAFALTINQNNTALQSGDTFTLNYMGKNISGTIKVQETPERFSMPITGGTNFTFLSPVMPDMPPPFDGTIDGNNNIYFDDTVKFPEGDQPITGVVLPDGVLVNAILPAPVGSNEINGKAYTFDRWGGGGKYKWNFSNNTYTREHIDEDLEGDAVAVIDELGNYSWDSGKKLLILLPVKTAEGAVDGMLLLTKEEALESLSSEAIKAGYTDAYINEMTKGKYTTVNAYVIAFTNYYYRLHVFNYKINGASVSALNKIVVTVLYDNINAMKIGGCAYTQVEPSYSGHYIHYLLSISYDDAAAILEAQLGEGEYYPELGLSEESALYDTYNVILEYNNFDIGYRLIRQDKTGGTAWVRLDW